MNVNFDDMYALHGEDFTAAMQASIDALEDTGGTILMSSEGNGRFGGTYSVKTSEYLTRADEGNEQLITVTTNDGGMAALIREIDSTPIRVHKATQISFENLKIEKTNAFNGEGVFIYYADNIGLKNIEVADTSGNGVHSVGGSHLTFENISIANTGGHGMRLSNIDGLVSNGLTIDNPGGYGIGIQRNTLSSKIYFNDTTIFNHSGDGVDIKGQKVHTGEPHVFFDGITIDHSNAGALSGAMDLRGAVSVNNANITLSNHAFGIRFRRGDDMDDVRTDTNGSAGYGIVTNSTVTSLNGNGHGVQVASGGIDIVNSAFDGFTSSAPIFVITPVNTEEPVNFRGVSTDGKALDTYQDALNGALSLWGGGNYPLPRMNFGADPQDGFVDGTMSSDLIDASHADLQGDRVGTGNDEVHASHGDDTIRAGEGNDTIYASTGDDVVSGEGGSDRLYGGRGDDTLNGGASADTVLGEDGNDLIIIDGDLSSQGRSASPDSLDGGAGDDTLVISPDDDRSIAYNLAGGVIADGKPGTQVAHNFENVTTAGGDDTITGASGSNKIVTGDGDDVITGDLAGDSVSGGAEGDADNDTLDLRGLGAVDVQHSVDTSDAGATTGTVTFANGSTMSFEGIETILADSPIPSLQAASVSGRIFIDANGDQTETGDAGPEAGATGARIELLDNAGAAIAAQTVGADGAYSFTDLTPGTYQLRLPTSFNGSSIVQMDVGSSSVDSDANPATGLSALLVLAPGFDEVDVDFGYRLPADGAVDGEETGELMGIGYDDSDGPTDGGGDVIDSASNLIKGNGGNDTIDASAGNDTVYGGDGDDVITGGSGADTVYAGAGNDEVTIALTGSVNEYADGGSGNDTLKLFHKDGATIGLYFNMNTGGIDDGLAGGQTGENFENVVTNAGDDNILGTPGDNTIETQAGDDTIDAGAGDDNVDAGAGDDLIRDADGVDVQAGTGNDTIELYGGMTPQGVINTIDGEDGIDTLILNPDDDRNLTVDMTKGYRYY